MTINADTKNPDKTESPLGSLKLLTDTSYICIMAAKQSCFHKTISCFKLLICFVFLILVPHININVHKQIPFHLHYI